MLTTLEAVASIVSAISPSGPLMNRDTTSISSDEATSSGSEAAESVRSLIMENSVLWRESFSPL